MAFLISTFHTAPERSVSQTESFLVAKDAGWSIECWRDGKERVAAFWTERDHRRPASFVCVFGWCDSDGGRSSGLRDPDCQKMLERHRDGVAPLTEYETGGCGVVVFDSATMTVSVQPDRWAMYAIYFSSTSSGIAVANRATVVANAARAGFDGYALTSSLRGTHVPFGRSLFSGVRRIMCGCYLRVDLRRASISHRRAFPLHTDIVRASSQEHVSRLVTTLSRVVGRTLNEQQVVLDLTGGNDTRLTAAAVASLQRSGRRVEAIWRVAGNAEDPDVRIAQKIAAAKGWELHRLNRHQPAEASFEELQQAVVMSDGDCLVDTAFGRIRQEEDMIDGRALVGSIGGELLRGFFWRHEFFALGRTPNVNLDALLAYRLYAANVRLGLLGTDAPTLEEHDAEILRPYREIGATMSDALNAYKLDMMYLHKLAYAAGNPMSWLAATTHIRLPLLTSELTDVTISIPWNLRSRRGLVLRTIETMAPELTEIPNDTGLPMRALNSATLLRYLACGATTVAGVGRRVARRYLAAGQSRVEHIRRSAPVSWLAVVKDSKASGVLSEDAVNRAVAAVSSGSATAADLRQFHLILTIELMLRAFPGVAAKVSFDPGVNIVT